MPKSSNIFKPLSSRTDIKSNFFNKAAVSSFSVSLNSVLPKLDEYAKKMCIAKQVTHYKRIDTDEVPTEVDNKVQDIFNTLEDSNDKVIAKVASKVANIK